MARVRIVLTALVFVLAAVGAAGGVAAQGGRWSGHLDVFTHFAPVYLTVGALALAVALFQRSGGPRTALAALGGVAAISSMTLIVPELIRPAGAPAPADGPGEVKIVQFNMREGGGPLEDSIRWLIAEDPDILVVEEGTSALRDTLARRLHRHAACGQTCLVTIFSRWPPVEIERPRRGYYGRGPAVTVARYIHPAGKFTVVGAHYVWPTAVYDHRENSRRLLEILKPYDHERLILAGDFNSTPWSFARRRDDAAFGLERRTRALFSWPATGFPILPIDHVYAGSGWRTVKVTRGPKLSADHYPIVATLAPISKP